MSFLYGVLTHCYQAKKTRVTPKTTKLASLKGLKEKGYEFGVYQENDHFSLNFWQDPRI